MLRRLTVVATASLLLACGGESGPSPIEVHSITVTPNPVELAQQASVQLQIAAFDKDGALLIGVPVTFSSGDAALVTVSASGMVQSVGPAGTASITVKAGTGTTAVPVTVTATGNTIAVLPEDTSLPQLGTLQLQPVLYDRVGSVIAGAPFTFTSADPSIATVDAAGLIHSVGPSGAVNITVTSGDLTAQKLVVIVPTPTSITLLPSSIVLGRSSQVQLTTRVLDAVGVPLVGAAPTFSAEPAALLSISQDGILRALGTPGSGSVTATLGTLSATVPVTVVDRATLTGTIVGAVPAAGPAYGVAMGAGGTFYGTELAGRLDVGTFGVGELTSSSSISGYLMTAVAVHPTNGLIYATGGGPDGLMEIDPASGTVLRRWEAPDQMYDVAISPDGTELYVAGSPSDVFVISTATMEQLRFYPTAGSVVHLLVHPTEPLVYASSSGSVREINTQTGATRIFPLPAAQAAALAIAGDRLFIGGESQTIGVVNLATGVIATTSVPCPIYDLLAAPDGQRLLATCPYTNNVMLLDAGTLAVVATINTGGVPRRAAISQDGSSAVIANESGWYTMIR